MAEPELLSGAVSMVESLCPEASEPPEALDPPEASNPSDASDPTETAPCVPELQRRVAASNTKSHAVRPWFIFTYPRRFCVKLPTHFTRRAGGR
jgi:hypothetical protein